MSEYRLNTIEEAIEDFRAGKFVIVVDDEVEEKVCSLIIGTARTGEGNFGDGRIFVTPIKKAYTISSKTEGL